MTFNDILYEKAEGAVTITINRPHRLNALSVATVNEMIAALTQAGADESARVVVITGVGDAFCSGADLKDSPDPMTPSVAQRSGSAIDHPFHNASALDCREYRRSLDGSLVS